MNETVAYTLTTVVDGVTTVENGTATVYATAADLIADLTADTTATACAEYDAAHHAAARRDRFHTKACFHCGTRLNYRRGSWDAWSAVADMFLSHDCDQMRAERARQNAKTAPAFTAAWNAALDEAMAAGRYDG